MRKIGDYIRFNEFTDAICSVQLVADLVQPVKRRPLLWKWIVVGAHNALQGAMVCALSGTDGTGALSKDSRIAMLNYLQSAQRGVNPPREFLADFSSLLRWVQQEKRMVDGVPLRLSAQQRERFRKLNALRRGFAHYTPKGWSIEATGLPTIVLYGT